MWHLLHLRGSHSSKQAVQELLLSLYIGDQAESSSQDEVLRLGFWSRHEKTFPTTPDVLPLLNRKGEENTNHFFCRLKMNSVADLCPS